ncbi:MAG: hypothetical protein ACYDFT_06100 [Thermoplasmata archaeon]
MSAPLGTPPFAAPGTFPPPYEPSEVRAIRSTLRVVRILALIIGLLFFLGGVVTFLLTAVDAAGCAAGGFCGYLAGGFVWAFVFIVFGIVDGMLFLQTRRIDGLMDRQQYAEAKERTVLWMIIGFITGAIILGIFLLIAYLDMDRLMSTPMGTAPPVPFYGAQPPPGAQFPAGGAPAANFPPAPPPPAAGSGAPCPRCGRPLTFIPQYGRFYCYGCASYP